MKEGVPNSAAVRLALSGSRYVDVTSMPWNEPVPGLRMKVLYKDNEAKEAMVLVEAKPGATILEHVHGGVEWAFVLEGSMEDDEGVVSAGNFVYRPAGSRHSVRMPEGQSISVCSTAPLAWSLQVDRSPTTRIEGGVPVRLRLK